MSIISWRSRPWWRRRPGGADPELVVAALLHDSIEVQEVPRAVLAVAEADRKIEIETGNK